MAHHPGSADSVVGFKHRLANYFERISGDISHLKQIFDTLPKAYLTPESQDTLMRFISDRCGIEEAEAAEELDYVTARLERERRNERFERLLEPWTTEQLEASLRQYFILYDPSQLSTVSALVTFHRGREITLIRELELQYRKPVLLHREDEEVREEEAGAMDLAQAAALMSHSNALGGGGGEDEDEDDDDDGLSSAGGDNNAGSSGTLGRGSNQRGGGSNEKVLKSGSSYHHSSSKDHHHQSTNGLHSLSSNANKANTASGELKNSGSTLPGGNNSSSKNPNSNSGNNVNSSSIDDNNNKSGGGGGGKNPSGGDALRIKTNWDEITVDSMQQFEMDILRFLLEIREELQERITESELLAQQYASMGVNNNINNEDPQQHGSGSGTDENNSAGTPSSSSAGVSNTSISSSPLLCRRGLRKSSTIRRVIAASQVSQQQNGNENKNDSANKTQIVTSDEVANSVNELSKELAALPRKRLGRVERMMQIIPLIARAVTPIFKSQLLLYLGFYCSLRVEARKVMQKRITANIHDAPLKADENFQRRSTALLALEKDSRNDILTQERRIWSKMDPLFYRERFLRMINVLIDEEQAGREEISFDEVCVSSVARAKLRSLLFIERSYVDLNFQS